MKVLILGDPHLGRGSTLGKSGLGSTLNSRIVDQLNLLDHVLERAVDTHVEHIIITGDVFEEPKPAINLITLFISWLKSCQAHGITTHIILGNHDCLRSGSVYTSPLDILSEAELEGVNVYKDIDTIFIDTAAFTLVPFRDRKSFYVGSNAEAVKLIRDSLVYELASIPETYHKLLIGHLAIEGSIPVGDEIDDLTNELFCPFDMFKGYDHVWMGHVHKPQVMKKKKPYIAHIGSMDISNFGETDQKKHIVIFDCINYEWDIEYLPTRPLQKIVINVPKDTEDTTDYVIKQIKKAGVEEKGIIRIEVALTSPDLKSVNKSIIDKFLIKNGAFTVNGISESKKISLIKKDDENTIDTEMDETAAIKTYAIAHVEEENRQNFIDLSLDILGQFRAESKE
jgi:DNA repair exonuclease SbcCD nuclease subunit